MYGKLIEWEREHRTKTNLGTRPRGHNIRVETNGKPNDRYRHEKFLLSEVRSAGGVPSGHGNVRGQDLAVQPEGGKRLPHFIHLSVEVVLRYYIFHLASFESFFEVLSKKI